MAEKGKAKELNVNNDPHYRVALLLAEQSGFDAKPLYEDMILGEKSQSEFWHGVKEHVKDSSMLKVLEQAEAETT
jgi:hypothetical protein